MGFGRARLPSEGVANGGMPSPEAQEGREAQWPARRGATIVACGAQPGPAEPSQPEQSASQEVSGMRRSASARAANLITRAAFRLVSAARGAFDKAPPFGFVLRVK